MRNYKITEDLRNGINEFLGNDYIKPFEIGNNIYRLEHYEKLADVLPEKARVLLATLFPEEVMDPTFLSRHKDQIGQLAHRLHVEDERVKPPFEWSHYMVRREWLPDTPEPEKYLDFIRGNIIRFV